MNLIRWNPWLKRDTFDGPMNFPFEDKFFPKSWFGDDLGLTEWKPVVDVYDQDDRIVLKAELPGVDKKDISVDVKDRLLTIKGERTYEKEVKEDKYYRKERAVGKFHRSFTLPTEIDAGKIEAEYKDGVLKVEIPRSEAHKPKEITVH